MPDENLPQESGFPETPENESNQDDTGEELEQVRSRVIELEALVAQKDEELAKANARVSELEQVVVESDGNLAQAVSSYKALVVKANPFNSLLLAHAPANIFQQGKDSDNSSLNLDRLL